MEWFLNLGWMVLAAAMCWLWVHYRRRDRRGHTVQLVSLALVMVMMFVVITMYDDMAMAQNPAETRCFQVKDELSAHRHASFHPVMASTPLLAQELPFYTLCFPVPGSLLVPTVRIPVLSSIQNRPPPAA